MIEIKNVHKKIGNLEILKGIDVTIKKGEVVVIIGPSGSGKTTFLRCLNYLENADEGTITFKNKSYSLNKATAKEKLEVRRKTAMVFQQYELFQNKSALENITEGLITARKVAKKEATAIGRHYLKEVGLEDKENAYPSQLSGGQKQRIGIARALVLDPEVILFDEPTSALDPEKVHEVLNLIKKVAEMGGTLLIVTHEINFAYEVADRVIFMEDGLVVEEGTPAEVLRNPKANRTREFLAKVQFQTEVS